VRFFRILAAIVFGGALAFGQTPLGSFTNRPQLPPVIAASDPQAQSTLNSILNAAGGLSVLSSVSDFTASGEITYHWAGQPVEGPVTLRGKGAGEFRLDAALPEGTRSWSVSHGMGQLTKADGTAKSIPGHNAINSGALTLPYLWLAAVASSPQTTVTSLGTVEVNGVETAAIRVQPHYAASFDPRGTLAQLTTRDFFIDPQTLQIVKMEIVTHPVKTFSVSLPEDIYFSNYQRVNGVMVPFTIAETINGQTIWTITLSSIQFNSGLTDTVFAP
jgi:hypothetical protein